VVAAAPWLEKFQGMRKLLKQPELFGVQLLSGIFGKKSPKRTWLCAGISPLLFDGPGRSVRRCGKSPSLNSKKFFPSGVRVFCE